MFKTKLQVIVCMKKEILNQKLGEIQLHSCCHNVQKIFHDVSSSIYNCSHKNNSKMMHTLDNQPLLYSDRKKIRPFFRISKSI